MVVAMCANPCVDRTVTIEQFTYGGMNRIQDIREDGSGKGVNVALACAQLGMEAACIGFMAVHRGETVTNRLKNGGCQVDFVPTDGSVRVNTKILDQTTGIVTELNESGNPVTAAQIRALIDTTLRWAAKCDYLVLTGSLPPGCSDDFYYTVLTLVRKVAPACHVVLDAEGPRFAKALQAKPFLIKPNRYELELLCGRALPTLEDIHTEAQRLVEEGVAIVLVSLGSEGAYITDERQSFFAPVVPVDVRSTVGAGDSMVGGMLLGLSQGWALEEAFRFGVAAATSSVTTVGTQLINVSAFREFIAKVETRRVP